MRVAVLMSAYNGEKYIREQMDSLLEQIGVSVEIFVRDDGSTDNTRSILRDYEAKSANIHVKFEKNIGVGNSFMELVASVPSDFDYYAFSDQDDIWLDIKLLSAIKKLKDCEKPKLYCSNQKLVDKAGNIIGVRFDVKPECSLEQSFQINYMTGCTMVWDKALQDIISLKHNLPSHELLDNRIHDVWVGSVAALVGDVFYDENAYILYRQHDNNVVGAKKETRLDILKSQLKKMNSPKLRKGRSRMARELVVRFPKYIYEHPLVVMAANANSMRGKLEILRNSSRFRKYTKEDWISFSLKVMFELF